MHRWCDDCLSAADFTVTFNTVAMNPLRVARLSGAAPTQRVAWIGARTVSYATLTAVGTSLE
jgi:hypothetical protein